MSSPSSVTLVISSARRSMKVEPAVVAVKVTVVTEENVLWSRSPPSVRSRSTT